MADSAPAGHGSGATIPGAHPSVHAWNGGIAVQRRGLQRLAAWLALPVVLAAMVALPQFWTTFAAVAATLVLSLGQLTFGKPSSPGRSGMTAAQVRIDAGALHVVSGGEEQGWPLNRLRAGWVDSYAGLHTVVIDVAGGDRIWIAMPSLADCERLLDLAVLGPEAHVHASRLASPADGMGSLSQLLLGAVVIGPSLGVIAAASTAAIAAEIYGQPASVWPRVVGAALFMACVGAVMQLAVPSRVVVGSDGVRIEGRVRRRFVPFAGVTRVDCVPEGLWLRRAEGDVLLRTEGTARTPPRPSANTVALHHRVSEALAIGRGGDIGAAKLALLGRRGQTVDAWLGRLRKLPEQTDYRSNGLDREELLRVLLDATGAAEARIAAAAALVIREEAGVRERVRIAAAATANAKLRIAIGAVADDKLESDMVDEAVAESEAAQVAVAREAGQSVA